MMESVHDDLGEEGAICEAEVSEDSSVESDNGGTTRRTRKVSRTPHEELCWR